MHLPWATPCVGTYVKRETRNAKREELCAPRRTVISRAENTRAHDPSATAPKSCVGNSTGDASNQRAGALARGADCVVLECRVGTSAVYPRASLVSLRRHRSPSRMIVMSRVRLIHAIELVEIDAARATRREIMLGHTAAATPYLVGLPSELRSVTRRPNVSPRERFELRGERRSARSARP